MKNQLQQQLSFDQSRNEAGVFLAISQIFCYITYCHTIIVYISQWIAYNILMHHTHKKNIRNQFQPLVANLCPSVGCNLRASNPLLTLSDENHFVGNILRRFIVAVVVVACFIGILIHLDLSTCAAFNRLQNNICSTFIVNQLK